MAFLFGASSIVDAYNLALVVPVLLSGVIAGWLQAGFVGRYIALCQEQETVARHFRMAVMAMVLVIALLLSLIIFFLRDFISEILVPEASLTARKMTESALAISAWLLIPTVIADLIGLILNCHSRFLAASAAPVANALVAALTLWLWPQHDLASLVDTLMLGWLAQICVLVVAYRATGLGIGMTMDAKISGELRKTLRLALPILPAVILSNATSVVIQISCSHLGEGAVAIYGYASRLHGALTQVMIVGISTVLLPHLAGMLASRQNAKIGPLFWRIGKATILMYAFILAGVLLLGEATIVTILGRGQFDTLLATKVTYVWLLLTLSILPFAFSTFLAKLFQAMQLPVLLSWSALVSMLVTAIVCGIGSKVGSLSIIVTSPVVAQLFVLAFFLRYFHRQFGRIANLGSELSAFSRCILLVIPSMLGDLLVTHFVTADVNAVIFVIRAMLFLGLFILMARMSRISGWLLQEGH